LKSIYGFGEEEGKQQGLEKGPMGPFPSQLLLLLFIIICLLKNTFYAHEMYNNST